MSAEQMVHPDLPGQEITAIGPAARARRKAGWVTKDEADQVAADTATEPAAASTETSPVSPRSAAMRRTASPISGPDKEQ